MASSFFLLPSHSIHPSAFLFFRRMSGIKDDSIARLKRPFQPHKDAFFVNTRNFSQIESAFFPKSRMHQPLIINPFEPSRMQPARKRHLHFVARGAERGMRNGKRVVGL